MFVMPSLLKSLGVKSPSELLSLLSFFSSDPSLLFCIPVLGRRAQSLQPEVQLAFFRWFDGVISCAPILMVIPSFVPLIILH